MKHAPAYTHTHLATCLVCLLCCEDKTGWLLDFQLTSSFPSVHPCTVPNTCSAGVLSSYACLHYRTYLYIACSAHVYPENWVDDNKRSLSHQVVCIYYTTTACFHLRQQDQDCDCRVPCVYYSRLLVLLCSITYIQ